MLVLGSEAEFQARVAAAETRKWLQRTLIARRSTGLSRTPNASAVRAGTLTVMLQADRLLAQVQGGANDGGSVHVLPDNTSVLVRALNATRQQLETSIASLRRHVTHHEADSRASTSTMCAQPGSCIAAFSFQAAAQSRSSSTPAPTAPTGFSAVRGAPPFDAAVGWGFTAHGRQAVRSFDTQGRPDPLHSSGAMANRSTTFRLDLPASQSDGPVATELLITVVSGFLDLQAPSVLGEVNGWARYDGYNNDAKAWESLATTAVATRLYPRGGASDAARATTATPCMLGSRGLTLGYFLRRSCRVSIPSAERAAIGPTGGGLTLEVVFGSDEAVVGAQGMSFASLPYNWLANALAVQAVTIPTDPVATAGQQMSASPPLFGALRTWSWIGPFDACDGRGLERVYEIEATMLSTQAAPNLTASYNGKGGATLTWAPYESPPLPAAAPVPFGQLMPTRARRDVCVGSVAFAVARVHADTATLVRLTSGMSGRGKVWVASAGTVTEVIVDESITGLMANEHEARVELAPGWTTIILKSAYTFAGDFVDVNQSTVRVGAQWSVALGLHPDDDSLH